ncbi:MAG: lysozyme, partial [Parafannyhessea umbonata]|nr:lysozyme [Parafannyhessea umbonata]
MRLSQNGVNFIKSHEALRLKAYQDSKGVWTIGWGHTKNVHPGDVITREQAEQFIRDDFAWVERTLNADLVAGRDKPLVTQNEFDALCSLVFNIGSDAYLDSTVRRKIK